MGLGGVLNTNRNSGLWNFSYSTVGRGLVLKYWKTRSGFVALTRLQTGIVRLIKRITKNCMYLFPTILYRIVVQPFYMVTYAMNLYKAFRNFIKVNNILSATYCNKRIGICIELRWLCESNHRGWLRIFSWTAQNQSCKINAGW